MAKHITIEDVERMKINIRSPIEVRVIPNRIGEEYRGNIEERILGFYAGTERGDCYDKLLYWPRLLDHLHSKTRIPEPKEIKLELVEEIIPLKR